MDSLYELVQGLSPKELSFVRPYLDFSAGSSIRSESTLPARLFDYLHSRKEEPTEKDACVFLYGTFRNKEEVFKKLKYRLKTKILDALSSELNDEKREMLDEVDYASFRVRKKSIQSRLLYFYNPKLEISRELLEEIISECKKFEFYGVLAEHINVKRWRYVFKEGQKAFNDSTMEAEYYKECDDAVIKANDYYYQLVFISERKEHENDSKVYSFLKNSISELKTLADKTKSNLVKYYLKFFELYQYMRKNDYQGAREICKELTEVVLNNPSVRRKQRLGIAYDHFSRCELMLGNFDKALEYARNAEENFIPSSLNYTIAKEQEFYALFYSGKYEEAGIVALSMLGSAPRRELGEIRYAQYNFLYANLLFKQRKFKDALHVLNQKWELSDEKGSREAELRILRIMTLIELENYEEAYLQTGSLKKFIQRNPEKASPRAKVIAKALMQSERKQFRFDEKSEHLSLLSAEKGKCKWELLSSELIPFHEWAKTKDK